MNHFFGKVFIDGKEIAKMTGTEEVIKIELNGKSTLSLQLD